MQYSFVPSSPVINTCVENRRPYTHVFSEIPNNVSVRSINQLSVSDTNIDNDKTILTQYMNEKIK
jgi:hypothetical protein